MSDKQVVVGRDERRKIARKLRAAAVYLPDDIDSDDLEMAIATTVCNYDVPNVETLLNRLADLVEPEPERTARMEYDAVHCDYVCTHCGERYYTMMYEAVVGDDDRVDFKPMRFCPNCGVRFKEDDDGNE